MRTRFLLPALLALCSTSHAQGPRSGPGLVPERISALRQAGATFEPVALFTPAHADAERDARWHDAVAHATLLTPSPEAFSSVLSARPGQLRLDLPAEGGALSLDLEQVDFFTDDFTVVTASNGIAFPYTAGVYYRGAVSGDPNSLVAISIFKDEVMGFVSKADGDFTIGKLEGDAEGTHILYRTDELIDPPTGVCGTPDDGPGYHAEDLTPVGDNRTVKCVRLYWEVNYDVFQGKGSVTNATNYVTGLFNQSAVLYNNDGISVTLSQVYVWDVASPYTSTSTSTLLDQFGTYRTSFNGDLAHLIGYAGGGGIAWVNGLCNSQPRYRMAYSGISSSYQTVPTFSWSVECVTHEQGHLMGSKHTHACAWNGNNTRIDGCGPAAGYNEGSCASAALPSSGGGTIMSYCHLVSGVGIGFASGFGPQPTTLIVNNINNASCLTACASGGTCGVPSGLGAGSLTTTSAALNWAAVSGATSYTLQWKPSSGSTWTTVTGLTSASYSLSGLSGSTSYQFHVLAVCSGGSSAYSSATSFTTTGTSGCPDIQEPNGTTATAGAITSGTAYNAIISSSTDADNYRLILTAISNISVTLGNLPYDYDVRLLNSAGTQVASSTAGNTTAESITYSNAAVGSYYVHVYGYNGAFSTATCYTLTATATVVASTCTDTYEPNETNGGARTIGTNQAISARIGTAADVDWFKFSNSSAQRYIKVTLTNLPANYDMQLWRGSGQLGSSTNSGTTNEQIIYNSNTISSNYRVKVYGVSGVFNAGSCYTLTAQISGTAFMPSGELEGGETFVDETSTDGMVAVFPNPAREAVHVVIPAGANGTTVEMMDATGRVALSFASQAMNAEQRIVMDVRDLSAGIWFLRVIQDGTPTVQRVVIEH
ncbi:MAG: T9SS type A sorting domain-containing protein [Flavobacteriales bacterium]|nr:T9SS type A sorting domain-containing protein [Flavobacteriales bacterium]